MEIDWTVFGILIGIAAVGFICSAYCWYCCNDSPPSKSRKSKMRFKRGHRTKFHHVVSSHSGDVEYCEDDEGGINIEMEDNHSGGDDGGGCDHGGGDAGGSCDYGGGDDGGGCDAGGGDDGGGCGGEE